MDLFIAILKVFIALPFLAGIGMLMVAMLNLMYDPGAVDEPGADEKQAVRMPNPGLFGLLMFLLLAPTAMPWFLQRFWPDLSEYATPLLSTSIALVLAALILGITTRRWPQALPFSWRRQPIMAYCLFVPVLVLVAVINRIVTEDIAGIEMPLQVVSGLEYLSGWPLAGD